MKIILLWYPANELITMECATGKILNLSHRYNCCIAQPLWNIHDDAKILYITGQFHCNVLLAIVN